MKIYISSDQEILVNQLVGSLYSSKQGREKVEGFKNLFVPQVILVQSQAMAHYLKTQIANHRSVAANIKFVFPLHFLNLLYHKVHDLDSGLETSMKQVKPTLEVEHNLYRLVFFIMRILTPKKKEYQVFIDYFKNDVRKKLELAYHLAEIFDNYFFYEPNLFSSFETDPSKGANLNNFPLLKYASKERIFLAQKFLYEEIINNNSYLNFDKTKQKVLSFLKDNPREWEKVNFIKGPLKIFGLSFLPEPYLDFLKSLSRYIPIELYSFDVTGRFTSQAEPVDLFSKLSQQNQLFLSSLNKFPKTVLKASQPIDEKNRGLENSKNHFEANHKEVSLLAFLKGHLYEKSHYEWLRQAIRKGAIIKQKEVGHKNEQNLHLDYKSGINIFSCQNELQEVEVLKDYIFTTIKSCQGREEKIMLSDFLVVAPNIDKYAHLVKSVFSFKPTLKYSICDLSESNESIILKKLQSILNWIHKGMPVEGFTKVLFLDELCSKFYFSDEERKILIEWVNRAGIKYDDSFFSEEADSEGPKNEITKKHTEKHTWMQGLKKIIYAYHLEDNGGQEETTPLGAGLGPSFSSEFSSNFFLREANLGRDKMNSLATCNLITRFLVLINSFFQIKKKLSESKSIKGWGEVYKLSYHLFFDDGFSNKNIAQSMVRNIAQKEIFFKSLDRLSQEEAEVNSLFELEENRDNGKHRGEYSFLCFSYILEKRISKISLSGGFLKGGITFASLLPMRAIPFKYIYMLGVNDENFPGKDSFNSYNLLNLLDKKKQLNFRSKTRDNELLFIEGLLCAKSEINFSFVNHSLKEGENDLKSSNLSFLVKELIYAISKLLEKELKENQLKKINFSYDEEKILELLSKKITSHPLARHLAKNFSSSNQQLSFLENYYLANQVKGFSSSTLLDKIEDFSLKKMGEILENFYPTKSPTKKIIPFELSELVYFFQNPSSYFFKNVLDLKIDPYFSRLSPVILDVSKSQKKKLASGIISELSRMESEAEGKLAQPVESISTENSLDSSASGQTILKQALLGDAYPTEYLGNLEIEALSFTIKKNFSLVKKKLEHGLKDEFNPELFEGIGASLFKKESLQYNFMGQEYLIYYHEQFSPQKDKTKKIIKAKQNLFLLYQLNYRDIIDIWIRHLFFCSSQGGQRGEHSELATYRKTYFADLANNKIYFFPGLEAKEAKTYFDKFISLFLSKEKIALPIFSDLAEPFIFLKGKKDTEAALNSFKAALEKVKKGYLYEQLLLDKNYLKLGLSGAENLKKNNLEKYLYELYELLFNPLKENLKQIS